MQINWLVLIITTCLLNWNCTTGNGQNQYIDDTELKKYIIKEKPAPEILVVRLGSDAITAINTKNGIIVIDAGISQTLTLVYKEMVEKEFKRNNFKFLINSHSHTDHTGGNSAFPHVKIIGHLNCIAEIAEAEARALNLGEKLNSIIEKYQEELKDLNPYSTEWKETYSQILRYQCVYQDIICKRSISPPTLVFSDSLSVYSGQTRIDLIYFGPAHSVSDIFIHIPDYGLLMTGDLVFKGGRASIEKLEDKPGIGWKKCRKWLENRWDKIEIIIGGHGQYLEKTDMTRFLAHIDKKLNQAE